MIQSVLFFVLGFLCAGLLALLIGPAIVKRAVRLTRKRVEASVPLTLDEIQADKDRLRAEFAMSTRRLEISVKELREKAAAQMVEIGAGHEELKQLAAERDAQNHALSDLEAKGAELRAELRRREDELDGFTQKLLEADRTLEQRLHDLEKLGALYEETSFLSTNRQVELLARTSEVEKLTNDVGTLKGERREADRRVQDIEAELRSARDAATSEKKKVAELEKKVERMLATIADREEMIDRREKDLSQSRKRLKSHAAAESDLNARLGKAMEEKLRLEAQVAELTLRLSGLLQDAKGEEGEAGVAKLAAERRRLDERLVAMSRENQKLRAELAAIDGTRISDREEERRQNTALREQMQEIAAEMIALSIKLDGPDSPAAKALESARPGASGVVSLAERVRVLREASAGS